MTHICVSKLTIIGSDDGLSPGRCQTIIWTNAGILLIGPLGTYFSEFLIEILIFSFKKMHLKVSSGLNVLRVNIMPFSYNHNKRLHNPTMHISHSTYCTPNPPNLSSLHVDAGQSSTLSPSMVAIFPTYINLQEMTDWPATCIVTGCIIGYHQAEKHNVTTGCQTSNIRCTQSQNWYVSHFVLQLVVFAQSIEARC